MKKNPKRALSGKSPMAERVKSFVKSITSNLFKIYGWTVQMKIGRTKRIIQLPGSVQCNPVKVSQT